MIVPDSWIVWLAAGFFFALGWLLAHGLAQLCKRALR